MTAPYGQVHPGPPPARPPSRWPWIAVSVAVVLVGAALAFVVAARANGTAMSSLHVVSEPVAAGRLVVVIDVTSAHELEVSAVDPATGTVVWQAPYSQSYVTPGVWPTPTVVAGVVVDLRPVQPDSQSVRLAGIDVASGRVVWTEPGTWYVTDEPYDCVGKRQFCIVTQTAGGQGLTVVGARSGVVVATVSGVERDMGSALFQTTAPSPTFEQLSPGAHVLWRKSVAGLFGPGYTPDWGWDFNQQQGLDIGWVGSPTVGFNLSTGQLAPGGASTNLGVDKTEGIEVANGAVAWTADGAYQCEGELGFVTAPVLCQYQGVEHEYSLAKPATTAGVSVRLAGFSPTTGAITWVLPVSDTRAFLLGLRIPFADGRHIVVAGGGGLVVVDLSTGRTASPSSAPNAYWCENLTATFKIRSYPGDPTHGVHPAAPVFFGCSAAGTASHDTPPNQPAAIGVFAGGMFVWDSPHGLEAEGRA